MFLKKTLNVSRLSENVHVLFCWVSDSSIIIGESKVIVIVGYALYSRI